MSVSDLSTSMHEVLDGLAGTEHAVCRHVRATRETAAATARLDARTVVFQTRMDRFEENVEARFESVETKLGLVADEVRVMSAKLERVLGWIMRDENRTS